MKRRDLLFNYGVPALLSTVALVQEYASHKFFLSPWKGGGFGMFSTADSPSARFLRIYAVTPEGKSQVKLPKQFNKFALEVRTIPTKERLLRLGRQLAQSQWISYNSDTTQLSILKTSKEYNSSNYQSNSDSDAGKVINRANEVRRKLKQQLIGLLPPRVLKKGEPIPSNARLVKVQEVQVELWHRTFNPKTQQLNARKISSSVVKQS